MFVSPSVRRCAGTPARRSGRWSPARQRSTVDLPEPVSPMTPSASPGGDLERHVPRGDDGAGRRAHRACRASGPVSATSAGAAAVRRPCRARRPRATSAVSAVMRRPRRVAHRCCPAWRRHQSVSLHAHDSTRRSRRRAPRRGTSRSAPQRRHDGARRALDLERDVVERQRLDVGVRRDGVDALLAPGAEQRQERRPGAARGMSQRGIGVGAMT